VATAIESIYRDMDYARSLIKRVVLDSDDDDDDELDGEHSTIRDRPAEQSGYSSSGSIPGGAGSEDWSVISEQDGRRSSVSSQHSEGRAPEVSSKRNSLAAAVMSVLPSSSSKRRTPSTAATEAPHT
jgi:hypothetical protein